MALRNELPARSRAINLKRILAAKWGRSTLFGQAETSLECSCWDCSHKFELPEFNSPFLEKGF